MKNKLKLIALLLTILTFLTFPLSSCSSFKKAREKINPYGYKYVAVGRYGQIMSNVYEEVDVRQYGIPIRHEFINFDGELLYFCGIYTDDESSTINDHMDIYTYNPITKEVKCLFVFQITSVKSIYQSAMHLKAVRNVKPNEFTFIATGHPTNPNAYEVTVDSEGNIIEHKYYQMSSLKEVINNLESRESNYSWANEKERHIKWIGLSDGTTEKPMFGENNDDVVWKNIKDAKGFEYDNVTRKGPYSSGYAVLEIVYKSGGLMTNNKEYYYFICSYEKGKADFFAYTGENPIHNIFIVE